MTHDEQIEAVARLLAENATNETYWKRWAGHAEWCVAAMQPHFDAIRADERAKVIAEAIDVLGHEYVAWTLREIEDLHSTNSRAIAEGKG